LRMIPQQVTDFRSILRIPVSSGCWASIHPVRRFVFASEFSAVLASTIAMSVSQERIRTVEEEKAAGEEEKAAVGAALAAREEELRRLEGESAAAKAQLTGEVAELVVCRPAP